MARKTNVSFMSMEMIRKEAAVRSGIEQCKYSYCEQCAKCRIIELESRKKTTLTLTSVERRLGVDIETCHDKLEGAKCSCSAQTRRRNKNEVEATETMAQVGRRLQAS